MERLSVSGKRIVDEHGGEVILHGLNLVCKDAQQKCIPVCRDEDFIWMQEQGFNVLRLGMNWAQAEPLPGQYDSEYLKEMRGIAERATKYGLWFFLDMHQDLYSQQFADGAPEWATLTDGLPHEAGEVWSDAYLESAAVNRALDHFWQNSPASDGKGLQEHYAALWQETAQAFADCPNLLGFDLMNEPYPGSAAQEVIGAMMMAFAKEKLEKEICSPKELEKIWSEVSGDRQNLLDVVADTSLFRRIVQVAKPPCSRWEQDVLQPFYQKIAESVQKTADQIPILLESTYFSNMAVESGLQKIEGIPCIYAPHAYDLVVDTTCYDSYSMERTQEIFAAHRRVQNRLDVPVLVGEWGAFYGNANTAVWAQEIGKILAKYGWSDTYWSWEPQLRHAPCLEGLCRGYPQRVGGLLHSYSWEDGTFRMRYHSDGSECRIYLPGKGMIRKCCPPGEAEIIL